ncbi:MAG: DUF998 domain-containing protein [Candidatus Jordarchaeaceae archaeon]
MLKSISEKPRLILIGGILAVISMSVNLICVLGAVITYTSLPFRLDWLFYLPILVPNTGYSMVNQAISELGVGPSAPLFNTGLIIGGILALPIFPCLLGLFGGSKLAKIGAIFGVIGALGAIGVGLCPMVVSPYHGLFAMIFFLSVGIAIILLSIDMYQTKFFPKVLPLYGFFFAIVDILFLLLRAWILEWMVFFVVTTWILVLGIWVLFIPKKYYSSK